LLRKPVASAGSFAALLIDPNQRMTALHPHEKKPWISKAVGFQDFWAGL